MNSYQNIEQFYINVLKNGPVGSLLCQNNHGTDQFLHYYLKNGRQTRESITKDINLQKALAQKEFARKSLEILEQNVKVLETAIRNIKPYDTEAIIKSMTKGYSKLPEEYFFSNISVFGRNDGQNTKKILRLGRELDDDIRKRIDSHREWAMQPYMQSEYMPQYRNINTSRGLKVRSKSEALIVESLYKLYDIPHRYEQEQIIDGLTIAPDLTFEDYKKELFYWEHLGKMDDPNYARRNFHKLERYYEVGIVPGDNLILSFDRQGMIDMKYIEGIIMNEVIPRL